MCIRDRLKIYEPEIILWLYSKTDPKKAFDFCFDDGILRQYFEFDKMYNDYKAGKANEHNQTVMEFSLIGDREIKTVPMLSLIHIFSHECCRLESCNGRNSFVDFRLCRCYHRPDLGLDR